MNNGIYFTFVSFIYIILLTTVFFSKKRLVTKENKIYSILIIVSFIGIVTELLLAVAATKWNQYQVLNEVLAKLYLVYLITWLMTFIAYIIIISFPDHKKLKFAKMTGIIIYILLTLLIFTLPISFYYKSHSEVYSYTYGPAVNLIFIVSTIGTIIMLLCLIINYKNIKHKKYVPIIFFIFLGTIIMLVQAVNPQFLLMTSMESFITFLMYFTIENPDMKMIEELNIAREQADRANNAKSEFLSNMSHEIRTPLNAIVGFSQALKEEELPTQAKEEVDDIISASSSLLEIVNGILDISKIEAGKLEIINTEYSFKKVYEELVALTESRIGSKPIEFRLHYDETIPPVLYGDHTRVKQVILNLLTNAAKYTKEGYIEMKVNSVIQHGICRLIISVEDSGIGIKNENISKLFSKFERFDLEKNITIEGTGLGLAITKKLLDLMGGKIVVQSVYGRGSKFTLSIDQKIVPKKELEESKKETAGISSFDGKKVLLVDDNMLNLKVASRLLKPYNVVIETVDSGFDCIEKIKAGNQYDLILLDDMMPKMSGVETLSYLKALDGFSIPTVALTANAISGMREKYLQAGFDDYLSKPIDKNELSQILSKFLSK